MRGKLDLIIMGGEGRLSSYLRLAERGDRPSLQGRKYLHLATVGAKRNLMKGTVLLGERDLNDGSSEYEERNDQFPGGEKGSHNEKKDIAMAGKSLLRLSCQEKGCSPKGKGELPEALSGGKSAFGRRLRGFSCIKSVRSRKRGKGSSLKEKENLN